MSIENNVKVYDLSELGYNDIYRYSDDTVVKSYVYEDEVGSVGDLIPRLHKRSRVCL